MTLDMFEEDGNTVIYARPEHGRPIAFLVEARIVKISHSRWDHRRESRWVVTLRGNRDAELSRHLTEENALRAALRRARKYDTAYSVPRGLGVAA